MCYIFKNQGIQGQKYDIAMCEMLSQSTWQFDKAYQGPLDATFYRELCAIGKNDITFDTYEREGNTKEGGFIFNGIAFNKTKVGGAEK